MDKTSLFYCVEVDHLLAINQLEGWEKDNEGITIVVCCNGDASDKILLWIIGKYANPRCFKNVNIIGLLFKEFVC